MSTYYLRRPGAEKVPVFTDFLSILSFDVRGGVFAGRLAEDSMELGIAAQAGVEPIRLVMYRVKFPAQFVGDSDITPESV